MFDYEVKIAKSRTEIRQAMKLRYEIFVQEMGRGMSQADVEQLDADKYDKFCEHLIVIDRNNNRVIGTYRLLLSSSVNKKIGFYSEKFFNIGNIKKLANDKELLELGRSCIHRDYRDRLVINLLWSGISRYVKEHNVRYLFGCVRLSNTYPIEVSRIFNLLKKNYYAPSRYRVYPKAANLFKGLDKDIPVKDQQVIWDMLPPLVKGYLRTGVVVCGLPAINPDFGSVVLFILLDIERMSTAYKRHFF